jgi:LAO/AO transport system kinase
MKNKSQKLTLDDFYSGIIEGNRSIIAQAISLIESSSEKHYKLAQGLIQKLIPLSGNSIRIGITGAPGVGKSTFIDTFGSYLIKNRHKVAVLAIDPSSSLSKGSILGDKTRMESLSRENEAFIRPSPSGSTLGGVARKTRETTLILETAGFDTIIIETIGVGQSEITVRSMVDFFVLLLLPGEGDELQGIKKGTVELADALIINKDDGDNINNARITRSQYEQAVHYIQQATEGWNTQVLTTSAIESKGIVEFYQLLNKFIEQTKPTGVFDKRRNGQLLNWFFSDIEEKLKSNFYNDSAIQEKLNDFQSKIIQGKVSVMTAVDELLSIYFENK